MANKIPVDTLYYATIVTRDAKALARNYAEFYGIDKWTVVNATPERLTNSTVHGRRPSPPVSPGGPAPGEYSFLSATGESENGGVRFQIVQPTGGLSTFEEFLVTRGQGVHGVFLAVIDGKDIDGLKSWLASENVPVGQSFTLDGAGDFYYFDTRKALGGFYVQVVVPRTENWEDAIKADDHWDFSGQVQRPPGVDGAQQVTGITHFGVVVPDVVERVETFARLFDQPRWRGMHWRTEDGWLEDTTNNGKPVVHGYFTGRGDVGKTKLGVNFGFEIVQPVSGPSHYKEDFLEALGPGIHHIDLTMPLKDQGEWDALNAWLAGLGAPTCMSGWLRHHAALFHYQDTRQKLGYVIEIHPPANPNRSAGGWAPDYLYDFSAKAEG
jgi:hypothetical protein